MKATTVKIEGDLLSAIESVKPPEQSVAAFVRGVLRKDIERERAKQAASRYIDFLKNHPDEAQWLGEWDRADLASHIERTE